MSRLEKQKDRLQRAWEEHCNPIAQAREVCVSVGDEVIRWYEGPEELAILLRGPEGYTDVVWRVGNEGGACLKVGPGDLVNYELRRSGSGEFYFWADTMNVNGVEIPFETGYGILDSRDSRQQPNVARNLPFNVLVGRLETEKTRLIALQNADVGHHAYGI